MLLCRTQYHLCDVSDLTHQHLEHMLFQVSEVVCANISPYICTTMS